MEEEKKEGELDLQAILKQAEQDRRPGSDVRRVHAADGRGMEGGLRGFAEGCTFRQNHVHEDL